MTYTYANGSSTPMAVTTWPGDYTITGTSITPIWPMVPPQYQPVVQTGSTITSSGAFSVQPLGEKVTDGCSACSKDLFIYPEALSLEDILKKCKFVKWLADGHRVIVNDAVLDVIYLYLGADDQYAGLMLHELLDKMFGPK